MDKRRGIDISKHQGSVDFQDVANDGIEFAILRCGYAKTTDYRFSKYVKGCLSNGIDIVGIYLFSYALNKKQAIEEAEFAIRKAEEAGLPNDTIIFFDLEYDTLRYAKEKGVTIGKQQCIEHTKAFCERVNSSQYTAGVYFNLDYYKRMYDGVLLDEYVRWLADWTGDADLPCEYHQYTSKGSVDGIYGNVDMNYEINDTRVNRLHPDLKAVKKVLKGEYGNGKERVESLKKDGYDPKHIQTLVNSYVKAANAVINGAYGNGVDRKIKLRKAGYNYDIVQSYVNKIVER